MPQNSALATKTWHRYVWCRDNGHSAYMEKHDKCDAFFRGDQWDRADLAALAAVRRPALTINKIISTLSTVMGEQIFNRNEIAFRPRNRAAQDVSETLTKVFKQISDNNQLDWKRSDMFADGIIGSRGYLDVRLAFNDSMQGEVAIDKLNPKNVIVDPDAEDYDPDTWGEVIVTKWLTADDIAVLYSREDAELLRGRTNSYFPYGYDSIYSRRDRFGEPSHPSYGGMDDTLLRNIRVIDRQHRVLTSQKFFYDPRTGDMRPVPEKWTRDRIAAIVQERGFTVVPKLTRRIRWTVVADDVVLHDDWSPYQHFTVVPYFPYFRHGRTIGLVENLLGPQELLNKVSSQELHVVNTTANSGWKVKAGALTNMSIEELEQRGAQTGLVVEVNEMDAAEKIQPNQTPTGLDRISYKAEEHIKSISNVSDSMQGFDREDVAARAIQTKRQAGATNLAKPLDSLIRSDYILARNVLAIVQEFYTEERIITITKDRLTGESEQVTINEATPEGTIANDLTIGEYDVIVSSTPVRESLEDSQFEHAVQLRELGVQIPDSVLIESSRLQRKTEIAKLMQGDKDSEEGQRRAELEQRGQEAAVAKTEGEAAVKHADAALKQAKAQKEGVVAQKEAATPPDQGNDLGLRAAVAEHDMMLDERRFEHEKEMDARRLQHDMALDAQQAAADEARAAQEAEDRRAQALINASTPTQPTKGD